MQLGTDQKTVPFLCPEPAKRKEAKEKRLYLSVFTERMSKYAKIIAVDFDGTLSENKYPGTGEPNRKLFKYLIREQQEGARIILNTPRRAEQLDTAVDFCSKYGLEFDAINDNVPEIIKYFGYNSRKIYANEYIDDHNFGKREFNLPFIMPKSVI